MYGEVQTKKNNTLCSADEQGDRAKRTHRRQKTEPVIIINMGSAARQQRFVLFRTVALPLALLYIFVDGQFRLLFRVATETAEIMLHHASQNDQQI